MYSLDVRIHHRICDVSKTSTSHTVKLNGKTNWKPWKCDNSRAERFNAFKHLFNHVIAYRLSKECAVSQGKCIID